jgi:hypothetical protein
MSEGFSDEGTVDRDNEAMSTITIHRNVEFQGVVGSLRLSHHGFEFHASVRIDSDTNDLEDGPSQQQEEEDSHLRLVHASWDMVTRRYVKRAKPTQPKPMVKWVLSNGRSVIFQLPSSQALVELVKDVDQRTTALLLSKQDPDPAEKKTLELREENPTTIPLMRQPPPSLVLSPTSSSSDNNNSHGSEEE